MNARTIRLLIAKDDGVDNSGRMHTINGNAIYPMTSENFGALMLRMFDGDVEKTRNFTNAVFETCEEISWIKEDIVRLFGVPEDKAFEYHAIYKDYEEEKPKMSYEDVKPIIEYIEGKVSDLEDAIDEISSRINNARDNIEEAYNYCDIAKDELGDAEDAKDEADNIRGDICSQLEDLKEILGMNDE